MKKVKGSEDLLLFYLIFEKTLKLGTRLYLIYTVYYILCTVHVYSAGFKKYLVYAFKIMTTKGKKR